MAEIRIFLPTQPSISAHDHAINRMAREFGGCTIKHALGQWVGKHDEVIIESVSEVTVYFSKWPFVALEEFMHDVATQFRIATKQECVLFVIDGEEYYV